MAIITKIFSALRLFRVYLRSKFRIFYMKFAHPNIQCHPSVRIGRGVSLRCYDGGRMILESGVTIANYAVIHTQGGTLKIESKTLIGHGSYIQCTDAITIGKNTLIAEYVTIRDQDHQYAGGETLADQGMIHSPIHIGKNCWLAAKVTITRGVTLADHVVIGSNAVVTRSALERGVYVGIPAKLKIPHNSNNN